MTAHENLYRQETVQGSSNRVFGLVFAAFFLIIGLFPLLNSGGVHVGSLAVGAGFLVVALVRPGLLQPLNRLWMRLGLLLNKIVSPILLGIIFYLVVTPMGLMLRLTGKDLLRLKRQPEAESYWIPRDPPGPDPQTMPQQF